jgi:hypothetical protein
LYKCSDAKDDLMMLETSRPRIALGMLARVVAAAIDLYALAALAYLVLRLLVGERWWPVELTNSLMPLPLLPALPALFLLLGLRLARAIQGWHMALLLPAVLAFALLYGGLFIPPRRAAGCAAVYPAHVQPSVAA